MEDHNRSESQSKLFLDGSEIDGSEIDGSEIDGSEIESKLVKLIVMLQRGPLEVGQRNNFSVGERGQHFI